MSAEVKDLRDFQNKRGEMRFVLSHDRPLLGKGTGCVVEGSFTEAQIKLKLASCLYRCSAR